jgi:hypothetical protein
MGFRNAKFPSVRKMHCWDAMVGVRKSDPNWVQFTFRGEVLKKLGAKPGDLVTPLVDMKEQLVLLLVKSDRPNGEERKLLKSGKGVQVSFPRRDDFAVLFQGPGGKSREMTIHELGPERIVFEGGLRFEG